MENPIECARGRRHQPILHKCGRHVTEVLLVVKSIMIEWYMLLMFSIICCSSGYAPFSLTSSRKIWKSWHSCHLFEPFRALHKVLEWEEDQRRVIFFFSMLQEAQQSHSLVLNYINYAWKKKSTSFLWQTAIWLWIFQRISTVLPCTISQCCPLHPSKIITINLKKVNASEA